MAFYKVRFVHQMYVLHVMSTIVERVGPLVRPYIPPLSQYLPFVWEESADHEMLRCAVLATLVQIVKVTIAVFIFTFSPVAGKKSHNWHHTGVVNDFLCYGLSMFIKRMEIFEYHRPLRALLFSVTMRTSRYRCKYFRSSSLTAKN